MFNGTTIPGLASTEADKLRAAGYTGKLTTGNNTDQQRAESSVLYGTRAGARSQARTVARRLDISNVQRMDADTRDLSGGADVGSDPRPGQGALSWTARVVFVLLVGATFGAFFVAQRLKGAPQVVQLRGIVWFSPNGDGRRDSADVALKMRKTDTVAADIVDEAGDAVRRVIAPREQRPARSCACAGTAATTTGRVVPDGEYRVRVSFSRQGRSIVVPRLLHLDTTAPRPRVVKIDPAQVVGPKAPEMRIHVRGISRRHKTYFRVVRTDQGGKQVIARGTRPPGLRRWVWDARGAAAGVYVVQVAVRDRAGNIGRTPSAIPPPPGAKRTPGGITVRSLAVQPPLRPVTAGKKAAFFVDSRRRPYRWDVRRVGAGRPVRRGKVAAAEAKPLRVTRARGPLRAVPARAAVREVADAGAVPRPGRGARRRARGRAGDHVARHRPGRRPAGARRDPRPAHPPGRPCALAARVRRRGRAAPGVKSEVAPLLMFLDRAGIRYDLTSDLDLTLSTSPRASDRKGVLLAGSERWVTRPLARRLRRYALDGGHVAVFGTDSLRRGVTLRTDGAERNGELARPTEPSDQDPFGARVAPVESGDPEPVSSSPATRRTGS